MDYALLIVPGIGADGVFAGGYAEQENSGYAKVVDLSGELGDAIDRPLELVGHGGDGVFDVVAVVDEERHD